MPWRFFSGVTFVLFCFVFRLYAFVEAAALRSIVLRYAGVPIVTHVSFFYFFLFFCLFGHVAFSEYFFRFLFVWRVRRTFFPSAWYFFYLVTTGWIFDISLCENSINQSINTAFFQHAHLIPSVGVGKERHINWSIMTCKMAAPVTGTTLRTTGPVPADSRE